MSGRERSRFRVRCLSTTTIQARKHGDRQPRIQIHRPFGQHRSSAFVTSLHGSTLTLSEMEAYPPEVLTMKGRSLISPLDHGPFGPFAARAFTRRSGGGVSELTLDSLVLVPYDWGL